LSLDFPVTLSMPQVYKCKIVEMISQTWKVGPGKRIRSTLESQEKLPVSFLLFVSSLQIFLFSLDVEIATLHFFFKLFFKASGP